MILFIRIALLVIVLIGASVPAAHGAWYPGFRWDWFDYTFRGGEFYDLYYDTRMLDRPGSYCTLDAAWSESSVTARVVCKDDRYSKKQNKPRLEVALVHDVGDDASDMFIDSCSDVIQKYGKKMILSCKIALPYYSP